ncbi:ABC transporter ATP-binding protein [Clostridium folliculivorans]|uniref:ABC transporter ATP-binding protein n=1 Tax=Clostridium folliculivorans TaxID=2886038 RepID=A0A9W5Y6A1_9CLOT|nr:ABC transporter ATP-binding protein [Clostridium folliculivorans]GKU27382.1 ABC transporter ATP-binding protein [Clostridium folliculivorans]GKU32233.1 ABC transporter ATP-binding protein [Clostridium folliculivorans]
MNVLEVRAVKKRLGKRQIIKGISLDVEEGEIFGFLGPNGAGKTTTIRMLVGLIKPDEGSIKIAGYDIQKDRENALANLGAVVENPELYGYLSGRENLMQIARIRRLQKADVDEVIELIGLHDRIDDKVKKYSLGMKQRLGLGAALLGNPKLMILDEPTNGLDPSGILDFREIVKKAAKERGMSVFVSSHILSEVQHLCDRVAFINGGEIKSVESVNGEGMATEKDTMVVSTTEDDKALEVIKFFDFVHTASLTDGQMIVSIKSGYSPKLVEELVKNNVAIVEIYKRHKGLEQRYMELVEGGVR